MFQSIGEWLGTPYKYSGESESGIDCSGFVCRMMRDSYHILLLGSAKDMYKKVNPIKKSELREGDLVFFKIKKGRISHVGIYLGQNKFAHASTQRGVTISDRKTLIIRNIITRPEESNPDYKSIHHGIIKNQFIKCQTK
ncbi:MAG: C40 family peptidase [Bacteroidetes bacterium]|nr:C40 family peptidase [Bacteroidota bacterium]